MKKNKFGFSLMELMVAFSVFIILSVSILSVYILIQNFWENSNSQIKIQSNARNSMRHMGTTIRAGASAMVTGSGNTLRVTLDPNHTPFDSSDDVICEYTLSGDELIFDPNITVSSNEYICARDVNLEAGEELFSAQPGTITITLREEENIRSGYQKVLLGSTIKMRNQ